MYGDCKAGGVAGNLVDVVWLPKKWGQTIKATRINGVANRLAKISSELDALPARFDQFLFPSAGTYVCRPIAGTAQISAHGHGIAIDIATKRAHYWRWSGGKAGGEIPYRNSIPFEIVEIFEKHGFIWGGKWYHYDTMHFEYRPELMATRADPDPWSKSSTDDRHRQNTFDGSSLGTNRPISAPQYWRLLSGALLP